MLGILDNPIRPTVISFSPPRFCSRRTFFLLITSVWLTYLVLSSGPLRQVCDNGTYCHLTNLKDKFGLSSSSNDAAKVAKPPAGGAASPSSPAADGGLTPVGGQARGTIHDDCINFHNTSTVMLVMKTGASEAYSKVPIQLATALRCLPDLLIFSDMAQKIAGYTIHDSLDTVLDKVKESNKDFNLYFNQMQCPIDQEQCNKGNDAAKQAWNLDKYKNIHMAEKAYAMRPNHDWYLFIDADTYVSWSNLMKWLPHLDSSKKHYIGSVAFLGSLAFGHGGSGYLVSQGAMSAMFKGKKGVANKYDEPVQHVCCGDAMWSKALVDETDITIVNAWPVINGEKPHTLPYAENGWCHPIVTLHHTGAQDISDIYAFEQERKFSYPLRIKDLYHRFVSSHLTDTRLDWDNLSDGAHYLNGSAHKYEDWEIKRATHGPLSPLEMAAPGSFEDCQKLCESQKNCIQFRYMRATCSLAGKIAHGKPVKKRNGDDVDNSNGDFERPMSGWILSRVSSWVQRHNECDEQIKWPVTDQI